MGNIKGSLALSCDLEAQQVSRGVTQRVVFSQPTIRQLSRYLAEICRGASLSERSSTPLEDSCAAMEAMVAKYTKDLIARPQESAKTEGDSSSTAFESIVLTGTTGALGSHLLAQLLSNDNVKRVWALNRASKDPAKSTVQRQRASFEDKLLDTQLLSHPKLEFVDCGLGEPRLGLTRECYAEVNNRAVLVEPDSTVIFVLQIQSTATTIIHVC